MKQEYQQQPTVTSVAYFPGQKNLNKFSSYFYY